MTSVRASPPQDPRAKLDNQTTLLGNRDELLGTDESALRVAPADQGFRAVAYLIRDVDYGLIMQLEFASSQCVS